MCTELVNLPDPQDTIIRNLIVRKEPDAQLAWKLAMDIPVANNFIIWLDMWQDHPGKFVLTLSNVLLYVAETVCCDMWFKMLFWDSVHIHNNNFDTENHTEKLNYISVWLKRQFQFDDSFL